jgi:hypothetical protein
LLIAGWILTAFAALFFLMDCSMKILRVPAAIDATVGLGYQAAAVAPIGVTLLIVTALYLVPQTRLIGAILLTGYLGAAAASNIRAGTPVFNIAFPLIFAGIAWLGLALRDPRISELALGR